MDNIRLYTRQNDKTLNMLESKGRIINERIYVKMHFGDMAEHYLERYDWFAAQAAKRVPRPEDVSLPIWCAIDPRYCLLPEPGTVIYILEVPKDKVIFFDDVKWDYVLNNKYLPADPEDEARYRLHLRELGISSSYMLLSGRYAGKYLLEERRIRESWSRVFDVPDLTRPSVCGNIWEIRREQVLRIVRPGEGFSDQTLSAGE